MSAFVVVDASKCIGSGVQFWTNPSGAILASETVTPQCMVSMASSGGSQLWSNTTQSSCWKKSQEDKLLDEGTHDPPETPPDWGDSDDVVMSGDEGPADEQPGSIRDGPMISSSAQDSGATEAPTGDESGAERPASSMITLVDDPDAHPKEVILKGNHGADAKTEERAAPGSGDFSPGAEEVQ